MSAIFDEGDAAGGEVQLTLDAAMIYEDLSTGLRAKDVFECATHRFPRAPSFKLAIWRFDVLRQLSFWFLRMGGEICRRPLWSGLRNGSSGKVTNRAP
jgi:hypothetical protein